MPFCTQCGNQVAVSDAYCAKCGARQRTGSTKAGDGAPEFLKNMSSRTASMLCYIPIFGWLGAILVLASNRFRSDRDVRFHAFQGLYIFVLWLLIDFVIAPVIALGPGLHVRPIRSLLELVVYCAWIWMIIKTSQSQMYRLPILGELAERSVAEQR